MEEIYVPSTWRRLGAFLIDQFFSAFMYLPFFGFFSKLIFTDNDVYLSLTQFGIMMLIPAVYEFVFLALMQATPGKWFLGLKVVPRHNPETKLEFGQCLLRPLVGRLSLLFSWAIYALAFFRYDRTHLCDWVAETRVVQFKPRAKRTRVRWVLGVLLILSHGWEGVKTASNTLQQINWVDGQVDLRALIPNTSNTSDFGFDEGDDSYLDN
jgi:uncharacterized RDD family membrane protein YckC